MVISAQARYLAHMTEFPEATIDDVSTALDISKTMCHTFAGHIANGTPYKIEDCQTEEEYNDALTGWMSGVYLCTGFVPDNDVDVLDPKGITHTVSIADFMDDKINIAPKRKRAPYNPADHKRNYVSVKDPLKPTVHGTGFRGVGSYGYLTHTVLYNRWANILKRCYCEKSLQSREEYRGVTVCKEWHNFQNFASWMDKQDWEGKQLDKDLKQLDVPRNQRVYAPEFCQFVTNAENNSHAARKDMRATNVSGRTGVNWVAKRNKWYAFIGIDKSAVSLGYHVKFEDAVAAREVADATLAKDGYVITSNGTKRTPGDTGAKTGTSKTPGVSYYARLNKWVGELTAWGKRVQVAKDESEEVVKAKMVEARANIKAGFIITLGGKRLTKEMIEAGKANRK